MKNDMHEELWRAFEEEVSEQLDNLDIELSKGINSCDINQIFRDFHTIKSSSAMLDMTSMKELAHISEDYLDQVRRQKAKINDHTIDILLAAVETLKKYLRHASEKRTNPEPEHGLIARLQQLVSTDPAGHTKAEATSVTTSPTGTAAALPELELSAREAVELLGSCDQLTPRLKQKLGSLANLAELYEQDLLASLCRELVFILREQGINAEPSSALLRQLTDLFACLSCLSEQQGLNMELTGCRGLFRKRWGSHYLKQVLGLADRLSSLKSQAGQGWTREDQAVLESCLDKLSIYDRLFGLFELAGLHAYIAQVIRSIRRGDCQPNDKLAAILYQAIDQPYAIILEEGEPAFIDGFINNKDFIVHSLASSDQSHRSIDDQSGLFEIDIDMSQESDVVESLVDWISDQGVIIGNTSVFDENDKAHIRFLVSIEMTEDELCRQLKQIDIGQEKFKLSAVNRDTGKSPVPENHFLPASDISYSMGSTLRIASQAVDALVTRVGEVVMARNQIASMANRERFDFLVGKARLLMDKHQRGSISIQEQRDLSRALFDIKSHHDTLISFDDRLLGSIQSLQEHVLEMRKISMEAVFTRMPNIVRKITHAAGRHIQLEMEGQEATFDKGMVDVLLKTLASLISHFVSERPELTRLSVRSRQEGNYLIVQINGNVSIPYQPALQTIQKWLEAIGGRLTFDDSDGVAGSTLRIPRSVAMQNVLLVQTGEQVTAVPERYVIEIQRFAQQQVQILHSYPAMSWRDQVLPVINLRSWLSGNVRGADYPSDISAAKQSGNLVILNNGSQFIALHIEKIAGLRDAFIPDNHGALRRVKQMSASTVLGDGRVVFILNVENLFSEIFQALPVIFRGEHKHECAA